MRTTGHGQRGQRSQCTTTPQPHHKPQAGFRVAIKREDASRAVIGRRVARTPRGRLIVGHGRARARNVKRSDSSPATIEGNT